MKDRGEGWMKSFADGMENLETRHSNGFCGSCGKYTNALWDRVGNKLQVSCEECGQILLVDDKRFAELISKTKGER